MTDVHIKTTSLFVLCSLIFHVIGLSFDLPPCLFWHLISAVFIILNTELYVCILKAGVYVKLQWYLVHAFILTVTLCCLSQVKQRADECILALDKLNEINSGIPVQNVLQTPFDWTTLEVTYSWPLSFFLWKWKPRQQLRTVTTWAEHEVVIIQAGAHQQAKMGIYTNICRVGLVFLITVDKIHYVEVFIHVL